MKYSQLIGVLFVAVLVASCFMPWAYYPDLDKTFNGFFSEQNQYGKPGKLIIILGVFATAMFLIPKIWAKRWNLLMGALITADAIKNFSTFTGCYNTYCPEKRAGIWVMLLSSIVILIMTLLPDLKIDSKKRD